MATRGLAEVNKGRGIVEFIRKKRSGKIKRAFWPHLDTNIFKHKKVVPEIKGFELIPDKDLEELLQL